MTPDASPDAAGRRDTKPDGSMRHQGGAGTASEDAGASIHSDTAPVGTDLQIAFSPMYAGSDEGLHNFKIPAVVSSTLRATWSTSDGSYVVLDENDVTAIPGVMIATSKPGTVKIIARAGALSGSATLNITGYSPTDCNVGAMRYNTGAALNAGVAGFMLLQDADRRVACRSCHSEGAQSLSVPYTPMQTGGWSDQELQDIFTKGFRPAGSVFITTIPPDIYQMFHRWDVTDQERTGLVCYLRSLAPKSQGMLDFPTAKGPATSGIAAGTGGNHAVGTGGASGGAAGRGGTGGASGVGNVPCGSNLCAYAPGSQSTTFPWLSLVPACCAEPMMGVCGSTSGATCAPAPMPAPKCPMVVGRAGCCADNNRCGVDASPEGMGCVEISQFARSIPTPNQGLIMLPSPVHCDGTAIATPDAG